MRERPLNTVPRPALALLCLAFAGQLAWQSSRPPPKASATDLTAPPSLQALQLASLGEPIGLAKALMLYLQAFDTQPGVNIPLRKLDYNQVQQWLSRALDLDPPGQYPLMAASRLYAESVSDGRRRQMLDFIYERFQQDPNRRWPWLAHAAILAKHRLKDLPLARQYAQAIRLQAVDASVPQWATQLEIFILEDMNETESARYLLGGLLHSGKVTDPNELRFLDERLNQLDAKLGAPAKP